MPTKETMNRKTVVVGGASEGLGRELAELMVLPGADVILLARSEGKLAAVRKELSSQRIRDDQLIEAQSVDLANAIQVENFVHSLNVVPSYVFCVAGGCAEEVGLFTEITPQQISSCFQKNYFTSAFLAHAMIKLWIDKPKTKETRHLVFTNSTAAFVALPGYAAYTPTKTALRALIDTLRQEVLIYESIVDIKIHCSFPGTILTEAFSREQERKHNICKEIEGTEDVENAMTAKRVAQAIVKGMDRYQYFIPVDFQTRLLLNNMRGPSPAETWVWDWLLGFIASLVWPFFRMSFDWKARQYRLKQKSQRK
ncbi:putative oxidoreductase,short chain dehydrogenase [Acephala macrosclerotiorum]|nr:putative oxidoreductase,short chain dehydrogenase [Acephala macrosclerotiorum]